MSQLSMSFLDVQGLSGCSPSVHPPKRHAEWNDGKKGFCTTRSLPSILLYRNYGGGYSLFLISGWSFGKARAKGSGRSRVQTQGMANSERNGCPKVLAGAVAAARQQRDSRCQFASENSLCLGESKAFTSAICC